MTTHSPFVPAKPHTFGSFVRAARLGKAEEVAGFSVRKLAARIGIEPSYLSKIERDEMPPPGEVTVRKLAEALEIDPDLLLAMAGKVSSDLLDIIRSRPALFAELLRTLKNLPERAVVRLVREVRDGGW